MQELPHDVYALFALACALGVKHGLDPDHLATIDGLIRFNATGKPWLSKWAGVLFSIGHGLVVTVAVGVVALLPAHIAIPSWLNELGSTVSMLTLLLLGVMNLYAGCNARKEITKPLGLKSWMRFKTGHPVVVLGIGALFALSFDTMSHAAFFSIAASHVSLELYTFTLGVTFTCGMIISDGLNGILTARLIRQSAERAMIASRVMSFVIGSICLLVAFIGLVRHSMSGVADKFEYLGVWAGIIVLLYVTAGFVVSVHMSKAAGRSG